MSGPQTSPNDFRCVGKRFSRAGAGFALAFGLMLGMGAFIAPRTFAEQPQKLPSGCQYSMNEMNNFLKEKSNENPSGEKTTVPQFNLMMYAGKTGDWSLVGEARETVGIAGDPAAGASEVPKGAVCILGHGDSGYPDQVSKKSWYQAYFNTGGKN